MRRGTTAVSPVAVDVAVHLTAIVRPEPEVGGFSASIPALPGAVPREKRSRRFGPICGKAAEDWLAVAHEDGLARTEAGEGP